MKQGSNKKYDTRKKRIQFLKEKGSIITFTKPFYPSETTSRSRTQIIVQKVKTPNSGSAKITGQFYKTPWFESLDELLDAIDWDIIEKMHSI